jgi:hypothetical protein
MMAKKKLIIKSNQVMCYVSAERAIHHQMRLADNGVIVFGVKRRREKQITLLIVMTQKGGIMIGMIDR